MSVQENEQVTHLEEVNNDSKVSHSENKALNGVEMDDSATKEIPFFDYEKLSLQELKQEAYRLLKTEEVHLIKRHMDEIRYTFDRKYADEVETKKEAFLQDGGQEIDFKYHNPVRGEFYQIFDQYKHRRDQYFKALEAELQANLARKQDIIEAIKALISSEEEMQTVYKTFQHLQQQWRQIGAVPRANSENLWNNYHHHVDNFYDFLSLNRELRDRDFKHNLEEKLKIIEKAEALAQEPDVMKASRALQLLHKVWKEELGPVDKTHREEIWQRFSLATKVIHDRKQAYLQEQEKELQENYQKKWALVQQMEAISKQTDITSHNAWQKSTEEMEKLREAFFAIGSVTRKVSEDLWQSLRKISRHFKQRKNNFYKEQKKEQQENLAKKQALIKIAQDHKDSEDWEATIGLMKDIQEQWKTIGYVPRKQSEKLWKQFKDACNHFFDRFHQQKKNFKEEEEQQLTQKKALLDSIKSFVLSGDKEKDLQALQEFSRQWEALGKSSQGKKGIEGKFQKILNALYRKLDFNKQDIEMLKYSSKLENLQEEDELYQEIIFVKRKIEEVKSEVLQLENNLQFFSHIDEKNPLFRDVLHKIEQHKEELQTWKSKLKELRVLQKSMSEDEESEA